MRDYLSYLVPALPPLLVLLAAIGGLFLTNYLVAARARKKNKDLRMLRQGIKIALVFAAILALLLVLPVSDTTQGQLITVLGLIITAVLTLSSTTFVANALAGVMLRSMQNFRPGDFLRVSADFGRVTERGLLHTEIQTEDGDLTTLPNLTLISTPYTIVQSSGTVVSATVSLGYEISRREIEAALLVAATEAELEQPFVQIVDLLDYSVVYRIAGFLHTPKQLLSARSNLRKHMLDILHARGIEIVSPAFMNQRRVDDAPPFIPPPEQLGAQAVEESLIPEGKIFDKAEMAEAVQELREEKHMLKALLAKLTAEHDAAGDDHRPPVAMRIEYTKNRLEAIEHLFEQYKAEASE
jgi:small-conductance mechanosensitive channel